MFCLFPSGLIFGKGMRTATCFVASPPKKSALIPVSILSLLQGKPGRAARREDPFKVSRTAERGAIALLHGLALACLNLMLVRLTLSLSISISFLPSLPPSAAVAADAVDATTSVLSQGAEYVPETGMHP